LYLDFSLVAKGCLLLIFIFLLIYATSLVQRKIISKIDSKRYIVSILASLSILYLLIVIRPIYENKKYFRFQGSHYGFGHELKRDYTNYFSDFVFEKFPDGKSLANKHFYESDNNKEFLLIIESWGKLQNDSLNNEYLRLFAEDVMRTFPFVAENYTIKTDSSKFYGSSIGSEARELFNGKSDDTYLYFMHGKNVKIDNNVVLDKKKNNFFTVAGYSSSGKFGVNASNVFDFRRRLGFDRIFTSENLNLETNINTEMEGFGSVYDEIMIDSLLKYVNHKPRYFGYGFTTNTHFPFIYDEENPYIQKVLNYKSSQLLNSSNLTTNSKNLNMRISALINHIFFILNDRNLIIDKIIIVGDHKYPGNHDFSSTTVPAMIVESKPNN
jgi:hypothetical protein